MKRLLVTGIFLFLCLLYAPSLFGVQAALLRFDKNSNSVAPGGSFDVQVVIDPAGNQVTSTDAWILYDKNLLSVVAVKEGSYFPTVLNDTTGAGKVYIAGLVNDPSSFKTGIGTVATITFKANAVGSPTITYECNPSAAETSKIIKNDINSTNIIDCAQNGSQAVTIASSTGGGIQLPTVAPTKATTPTTIPSFTPTVAASPTLFITQLPLTSSQSASPTALPVAGSFENLMSIALPGVLLFAIGGILKVLLHI